MLSWFLWIANARGFVITIYSANCFGSSCDERCRKKSPNSTVVPPHGSPIGATRLRPYGRRKPEAIGKARNGDGPTFIECETFRFRGHYFGDRTPYIPKEQLEAALAADPVPAFRRHLVDSGACTDDELNRIDEGALTKVEDALKTVLGAEVPLVDELDRDVYATPIRYPV